MKWFTGKLICCLFILGQTGISKFRRNRHIEVVVATICNTFSCRYNLESDSFVVYIIYLVGFSSAPSFFSTSINHIALIFLKIGRGVQLQLNVFMFSFSPSFRAAVRDHKIGLTDLGFGIRVENFGDVRFVLVELCFICWQWAWTLQLG